MAYKVEFVNLKKEVCKIVLKKNEQGSYSFEEILQELESAGIKFEDGQSEKELSYVLVQLIGEGKLLIDGSFIIDYGGEDDIVLDVKDFGVTGIINIIKKAKRQ